ncbi:DNA-directed RNA polymerase I subunit rpa49 [Linum perenne]
MSSVVEPEQYSDVTNPESLKKSKKKKRKIDVEDVDTTAAAAVIPPQTMTVKVELIHERPNRTSPVVGYFPSGYNPHYNGGDDGDQSMLPTVNLYKNVQRVKFDTGAEEKSLIRKGPEKLELVVNPEGSKIDFVGTSYKGEASNAQLATYALGVLDKDTSTLKIMPVAANKIFRLEPILRGHAIAADEDLPTEDVELTAQQKAANKRKQLASYSTKKSVARDKKRHNLTQGLDEEPHPELGDKIESIPVNKEATVSTAMDFDRNIPPHNASATIPKEAYPLEKIIDNREWDFLKDIEWILQSGEVIDSAYPIFVRNRIHKLKAVKDDFERATLSGILCYITHLIKFKNLQSMDTAASARDHKMPPILKKKFGDMFTPDSKRLLRGKLNLLISYVLVLVLHFDDFKTDPADIAKDLGQNIMDLRSHFENLGCKFVAGENRVRVATLPVPIHFPEGRKRKKRY